MSFQVYYHLPGAEQIESTGVSFLTLEDAMKNLTVMAPHNQYIVIIKGPSVSRYLVSKGCGVMEIIPMENKPGWSDKQQMLSNIVNFVMASEELPVLSCEEDE